MDFFSDFNNLQSAGFNGFVKVGNLLNAAIPKTKGIYLVINREFTTPSFLEIGSGGAFKGKNPNVPISELHANWVSETCVLYIGKAGSTSGEATLRSRLSQYGKFGQGQAIGHWGGRYIWQLTNVNNLIVCWKALPDDNPRTVEKELIQDFKGIFYRRPFANLRD